MTVKCKQSDPRQANESGLGIMRQPKRSPPTPLPRIRQPVSDGSTWKRLGVDEGQTLSKDLLLSHRSRAILIWETNMSTKADVWQGTLALMVLKTLNAMGPQHGFGIARRIEQTSDNLLSINHGTLYPVLLKLEQEGAISSEWGVSENNRRAKFYRITKVGQKQLASEVTSGLRRPKLLAGSSR